MSRAGLILWAIIGVLMLAIGLSGLLERAHAETGLASWYRHGKVTANGERFAPLGMTCAHRSLPFGTILEVTVVKTGRKRRCRINDRGPFVRGRFLDLSLGMARALGIERAGVARVRTKVVKR